MMDAIVMSILPVVRMSHNGSLVTRLEVVEYLVGIVEIAVHEGLCRRGWDEQRIWLQLRCAPAVGIEGTGQESAPWSSDKYELVSRVTDVPLAPVAQN
jgi:hypothetical protein